MKRQCSVLFDIFEFLYSTNSFRVLDEITKYLHLDSSNDNAVMCYDVCRGSHPHFGGIKRKMGGKFRTIKTTFLLKVFTRKKRVLRKKLALKTNYILTNDRGIFRTLSDMYDSAAVKACVRYFLSNFYFFTK